MQVKIKIIETFSSVLKSKKSTGSKLKKLYEFFLIKKASFSPVKQISLENLVLGAKIQKSMKTQGIKFSPLLQNSLLTSYLIDVDRGISAKNTKYFKFLKKYGGSSFAHTRTASFNELYKNVKKGKETQPILVYEDLSDWQGYFPDYPFGTLPKNIKDGIVIFDGHHRAAIFAHLKHKKIPAKLIKKDPLVKFFRII